MIKVLKYWQSPQYANYKSLWRAGIYTIEIIVNEKRVHSQLLQIQH